MSQDALTKICTSCGQRKPLSAFLQINKAGTVAHGQICASCRKTLAENAKHLQKGDDAGTQETGHKIDTKARMQAERDKRQHQTNLEENYHEGRDQTAIDTKFSEQKKEAKQQTEKKLRDSLFAKQSFITQQKQTPNINPEDKAQTEQHIAKEERLKTQHDFTMPYHDPQVAGQLRFQSAAFKEFRRRLGKESPLVRAAENAAKGSNKDADKNKPNETLEEHIEKTWGPKKR